METLKGKTAVVTGAASGIGLASTDAMLAAGARVVMVDRDAGALEALVAARGGQAIAQVTDLLDEADCDAMIPESLEKVGQIDILLCNSGTYIWGDLIEADARTIDRMLNLNINAVIKNVHAVLPHMIGNGSGDILVTSSLAGRAAIKHEPVYSASKWAVTCFTQTVRRQVNRHGIRVAQVSPGPVSSALLSDWEPDRLQAAKDSGAIIDPSEVAAALMFILERPRNVTIHDIVVLPTNVDA
ncbi:MAG: SDR family oxidoreductase [Pseudorhodobacter sp.]